jgi:hypothetical protein
MPGRRDSQTFQIYLTEGLVHGKVGYHRPNVTDVTVKMWKVENASFSPAEHLMFHT